jgi:hypothetical protein
MPLWRGLVGIDDPQRLPPLLEAGRTPVEILIPSFELARGREIFRVPDVYRAVVLLAQL